MLIRISLILAIVAGLAVGTINFTKIKGIITDLRTQLDTQTKRAETAEADRDKTKRELTKTKDELTKTTTELANTKKERDTAVAKASDLQKQADKLQTDLAASQKEYNDAKIDLDIYRGVFPTTQQAINLGKDMKALQERVDAIEDEKKVLQRQLVRVQNELDIYKNPEKPVELPASLIGKILVTDPKWDFVVLNVGENQGAVERGEMLVNRDGKLVAKVKITSVQKDRCIANVLPGWKLGQVLEGDQVIPAYPSQS